MASIEYSTFADLYMASPATPVYFMLGNGTSPVVGTTTILRYMVIMSSQSVGSDITYNYNYIISTSPSNGGALTPMFSAPRSVVAANTIIPVIQTNISYVTKNPYLAIQFNMDSPGGFYIFYSFYQFPNGNLLNNNFSALSGSITNLNPNLVPQTPPYTNIIKSTSVMNLSSSSTTFQYTYDTQNISDVITLGAGEMNTTNIPVYVAPPPASGSIGISASGIPLNYYISLSTNMQQ